VAADVEVTLPIDRLHLCRGTSAELENFVQAVRLAVVADQANRRLTSEEVARELNLERASIVKLGRLMSVSQDACRSRRLWLRTSCSRRSSPQSDSHSAHRSLTLTLRARRVQEGTY
jgi:hypothetical protein